MKKKKLFSIIIVLALSGGCATYSSEESRPRTTLSPLFSSKFYPRLAILVVDNTRRFRIGGALRQVEDEFMRAAIEKGYTLAARSDLNEIKKELDLQRSSLTEKEVAKIGHFLNVPAVVLVSINHISTERYNPVIQVKGKRYYAISVNISARLIGTELAEVLCISSHTGRFIVEGRGREHESQALVPVAKVVASGLPNRFN